MRDITENIQNQQDGTAFEDCLRQKRQEEEAYQ